MADAGGEYRACLSVIIFETSCALRHLYLTIVRHAPTTFSASLIDVSTNAKGKRSRRYHS